MQEALHAIHHHNNCKSDGPENWPHNEGWNNSSDNDQSFRFGSHDCENTNVVSQNQIKEHLGQLSMSK